MNLVKLKDADGNEVHVNPDTVIFVVSSKMIGQSAVQFIGGLALNTSGSALEVRNLLSEKALFEA